MLLTALLPKLAQPAFSYTIQDDLPTCGITPTDLDSPISFTKQESALQTYLEANSMKKKVQCSKLKFIFPNGPRLSQADAKVYQHMRAAPIRARI